MQAPLYAFLLLLALPASLPSYAQAQTTEAPKVDPLKDEADALKACVAAVLSGIRPIAATRDLRFEGKVSQANALCRGGEKSLQFRLTPWVDWQSYWGTGDMSSLPTGFLSTKGARCAEKCWRLSHESLVAQLRHLRRFGRSCF